MGATLRIREVNIKDPLIQQAIVSLTLDTFAKNELTGPYEPSTAGHWWVAFDGKLAVGYAGIQPSSRYADCGYLCLSGVLPSHRGMGLQKRFIKKRIERARSLKWQAVFTETICTNSPSMASLIRCGFKPYTPAVPWGDPYAVYWRKQL